MNILNKIVWCFPENVCTLEGSNMIRLALGLFSNLRIHFLVKKKLIQGVKKNALFLIYFLEVKKCLINSNFQLILLLLLKIIFTSEVEKQENIFFRVRPIPGMIPIPGTDTQYQYEPGIGIGSVWGIFGISELILVRYGGFRAYRYRYIGMIPIF